MNKLGARGAIVVGAAAVSIATFGSGVAAADALAGMTYAKASEMISEWKATTVIATVVGDQLPMDECIVTRSQVFTTDDSKIALSLNCNAQVASATSPGNSLLSPQGRSAKQLQIEADWVNTHPESCTGSDAAVKYCDDFCEWHADLLTMC